MKTAHWLLGLLACALCSDAIPARGGSVLPGVTGFGLDTRAGQGGKVIRVTNLDAAGPGSLRAALEADGPRIVVFEVGGVIDLDRKSLSVLKPFLTLAGQTAPSPGITIIRGALTITTHDVLVQHIRVRPGDAGRPKRSGWEPDGISVYGADAYNVVIDHCSVSWAVDENLSASGARTAGPKATARRVTFSNCIIAEGLHDSSHRKGPHSKGSLIHDFCQDIAVIGNLYAHNDNRNPYFKAYCTGAIVNNVIYNPGRAAIKLSYAPREWREAKIRPSNARASVVGNVLLHGQNTMKGLALVEPLGDAYMKDNRALDREGKPAALTRGKITVLREKPAWPQGLRALPAAAVLEHVLTRAGARPRDRDDVDARIVRGVRDRKGQIIDSQEDVGGYPKVKMTRRKLDLPAGDIEAWLRRLASKLEQPAKNVRPAPTRGTPPSPL